MFALEFNLALFLVYISPRDVSHKDKEDLLYILLDSNFSHAFQTNNELMFYSLSLSAALERQEEIIPEHPNNSNIRCSPQDKRCIQKTLARHPSKPTNQRNNMGREEAKTALVRKTTARLISLLENNKLMRSLRSPSAASSRCFTLGLYRSRATSVTVRL